MANLAKVIMFAHGAWTRETQFNVAAGMEKSTTYRMSCWYGESSTYNAPNDSGFFHARAFSSTGNNIFTPVDLRTLLRTQVVDGVTWEYRYKDYNSKRFQWSFRVVPWVYR